MKYTSKIAFTILMILAIFVIFTTMPSIDKKINNNNYEEPKNDSCYSNTNLTYSYYNASSGEVSYKDSEIPIYNCY